MGVQPVQLQGPLAQKGFALGLMLSCPMLKFLIIFEQGTSHLKIFTGPHKLCGHY